MVRMQPSTSLWEQQQHHLESMQFSKRQQQQNLESSSYAKTTTATSGTGYQGSSGRQRTSSLKKRGGKSGSAHSIPTIFSGLYRVFFKMDEEHTDAARKVNNPNLSSTTEAKNTHKNLHIKALKTW